MDDTVYFGLQCLCCSGFYIKKDSLILYMTGGRIDFGLTIRVLETLGAIELMLTTPIFISNIISRKQGTTGMMLKVSEEAFMTSAGISIHYRTLIIIIICTMFTKTSTNKGEVRIQVLCIKSTQTEGRMMVLGSAGAERKGSYQRNMVKKSTMNSTSTNMVCSTTHMSSCMPSIENSWISIDNKSYHLSLLHLGKAVYWLGMGWCLLLLVSKLKPLTIHVIL